MGINLLLHGLGMTSPVLGGFGGMTMSSREFTTDLTGTKFTPSLSVPCGIDFRLLVNLQDGNGNNATGFLNTDSPSALIWAGQSTPILLRPAISWQDADAGILKLALSGASTSSLGNGRYKLRILISVAGLTLSVPDQSLILTESPTETTPPPLPVYCEYDDLLLYAPWLDNQEDDDTDQTGYARQRAQARAHLDRVILSRVPISQNYGFGNGNFSSFYGYGNEGTNSYVFNLLESSKLVITPQVIEISSRYSVGLIAESMISPGKEGSNYQQVAATQFMRANALILNFIAEFDTQGTGEPPFFSIPCNTLSSRVPIPSSSWGYR